MNTSTKQLVLEIKQISGQYLAEVGTGGYRVWPKSIRDRVLLLCDLVGSATKAAEMCGVSRETIYQWRAEAKKSLFKSLPVIGSENKSVTVTVPTFTKENLSPTGTVTVTTPHGYIVSGLDFEQLLIFFKQSGGL